MTPDPSPSPSRRGLSLEHRLPLMITALLVATMAAVVLFAWAEVRQAATRTALERLRRVTEQLALLSGPTVPARLGEMRAAAGRPAILAHLQSPDADTRGAATQALQGLRTTQEPE